MLVINPRTLPEELLRIAAYYCDGSRRPFTLAGHVRDDLPGRYDENGRDTRVHTEGEYVEESRQIRLYLARIERNHPAISALPPLLGAWLAVLEVFLHEAGHHRQRDHRNYRDDYRERGYTNSWPEHDARSFAYQEIHRLATLDDDLFLPRFAKDMGYLGIGVSKYLGDLSREVRGSSGNWKGASILRQARLRAIHVPARKVVGTRSVVVSPEKAEELQAQWMNVSQDETGQYFVERPAYQANPDFRIADACGFTWSDRRGHRWRYLRLGQAVRAGLLEKLIDHIDPWWL